MFPTIHVLTEKYNHNMKVENYFIWWECVGFWVQETASQYLWKKCSKEQEGKSSYIQVCNKESRQSEHQRSGIELKNVAYYAWEDASLWAHRIQSFYMHLNYLGPNLFPCSPCFSHSPSFSVITLEGGSTLWITVLGTLTHIWRPEVADGCYISCLIIWQEIFSFHVFPWEKKKIMCIYVCEFT